MDERLREELKSKINFIVVGIVSFLAIGAIPFLVNAFDNANDEEIIKQAFPDSTIGWVVWAILRLMIVVINFCILIAFVNQGKINVSKNEGFKASIVKWIEIQIFKGKRRNKTKRAVYLTPKQHYAKLYSTKGLSLAIGSFASCFTITFVVLNWDLATFIIITITVMFAIVFGFLQMQKEEYYWLNDFKIITDVEYEKMQEQKNKEEKEKCLLTQEEENGEISMNK